MVAGGKNIKTGWWRWVAGQFEISGVFFANRNYKNGGVEWQEKKQPVEVKVSDDACPSNWRERVIQLTDHALTNTHGLPGAPGFLHMNDCIRRYPGTIRSPMHLLCIEWAAVAIMMHDMKNIYWGNWDRRIPESHTPQNPFLRLSFDRDPLSSIVTVVDVIQEFDRSSVKYGSK